MFRRFIPRITLLCLLIFLLSACMGLYKEAHYKEVHRTLIESRKAHYIALQKQLAKQQAGSQQQQTNSTAAPVPLSPMQLAAQNMISDTLIGKAYKNNFNFEIKITEGKTEGEAFTFIGMLRKL